MLNTTHNILFKAIVLALCVISFVHIFLFPLNGGADHDRGLKTFSLFEQGLCTNNLKSVKARFRARCPQYGIVTIMQGGRLGNQMWEYASVWALARRTGLEPYVPRCIRLKLDQVFETLSVPSFQEIAHCPVQCKFVKSLDAWNFTNQSIILPKYSIQPELVLTWVQDIVQEFTIKKKLREKSWQVLRNAIKNSTQLHTFVGVHVRRSDYLGYLLQRHSSQPANDSFYFFAMEYFQKRYNNVIFIVVSDDPLWCLKKFGGKDNVYIASRTSPANSPALDLSILASCNHSIYDYGTFGEWGAILAGGETIFYNLTHHSSIKIGQILKNWHTI